MSCFLRLLSALLLAILVSACSTHQRHVRTPGHKHQHSHQVQHNQSLTNRVGELLEKKQYQQALEAVTEPNDRCDARPGFENQYVAAMNGLLETGKEALLRNDYPFAGQHFRAALKYYPKESRLQEKLKTSQRRIRIYLDTCSGRLMEQGLQEYRRGELDKAIETWRSLVAFNSEHADARKAIETAMLQKKNLKSFGN